MSASLSLRFLDSYTLGSEHSIENLFDAFSAHNFEIDEIRAFISGPDRQWQEFTHSSAEMLSQAYEAKEFSFRGFNPEWRLEVHLSVGWGVEHLGAEHRAYVSAWTDNTPCFRYEKYQPAEYARVFLELGKSLYRTLRPSYGWADFNYGLPANHEDVEFLRLPAIHWANFFGPPYVKKIGRDTIKSAPAYLLEELPDGGFLYVLGPHLGQSDEWVSYDEAARHFGIATA